MKSSEARQKTEEAKDDIANSGKADKAKGHTKETIGNVRQKVGSVIGSEEMEAKGAAQEAEGKKDRLKGEIKEGYEDVKDRVKAGAEVVKDKVTGH